MQDEQAVLEAAELLIEAVALSEALLDGDITEARFRAGQLVEKPAVATNPDLRASAGRVVSLLGPPGIHPLPGYADAVVDLTDRLEQAAAFLRG